MDHLISPQYLQINRLLHQKYLTYGMSGHWWAPKISKLARQYNVEDILDYGCGKGTLRNALIHRNYAGRDRVYEYDPAIAGKEHWTDAVDFVVCCDVLEHIEPDKLNAVLEHIHSLAKKLVFGVIATRPAHKCLPDGRNAHLIQWPAEEWKRKLEALWTLVEFSENTSQEGEFIFVGTPNEVAR
jgi:SAM-dependent methyltransferase